VVVLCYRAEDFAPVFVARMKDVLERKGLSYELVLVANYHPHARPPDRTPEIVRELARNDPTLTVVARPKEGMMGWDMRSGLAVASGKTVAVIDGDGQMPPEDVVAVYECLHREGCDLATTFRTVRHDGALRRLVSRTYNVALRCLFPSVKVRDANGKPKIFTREALAKLSLHFRRLVHRCGDLSKRVRLTSGLARCRRYFARTSVVPRSSLRKRFSASPANSSCIA
jgi:glycosyltransferase involved in cell wall biosynthesis